MHYNTIDIFTDASINAKTGLACAGFIAIDREKKETIGTNYFLDYNSTNNRAEIIGIEKAVEYAVMLLRSKIMPPFMVNIISDSMISVNGIREWILTWSGRNDGTLYNSQGKEVANQSIFKNIFSIITSSGLKVKFYHQKGHVNTEVQSSLFSSQHTFYASNLISIENAGMTPKYLAEYNSIVDNTSRAIIQHIERGIPGDPYCTMAEKYNQCPMEFYRNGVLIDLYKTLLTGGINYPV